MSLTLPTPQLILDYNQFYNSPPPESRIEIIKDVPTEALLFELIALNYRLKPKNEVHINDSLEFQIKELHYFTKTNELRLQYSKVAEKYTNSKQDYPLIFIRQSCLYAIEEILNSNFKSIVPSNEFGTVDHWESILKYLLAINTVVTQIKEEKDENEINFESLNPKFIPLNELSIEVDPVFTPYRGYWLLKYFQQHQDYSQAIKQFFNRQHSVEPDEFILHILSNYLANNNENPEHDFFYLLQNVDDGIFDSLSNRINNNETFKLLNIRKNPFIQLEPNKFLLTDNIFLLEKCYSQFINDFWFDELKNYKDEQGTNKFNIHKYRSDFGYFFETYIETILKNSFQNYKHSKLLLFDDLKVSIKGGEIELADVYFRYNNKVIIGQVKSGNIYDTEKYGGDVVNLYKIDRNAFLKNFGVNQIIDSIKSIDEHISELDQKYPKGHQLKCYPCIIVNDKALQTPFMADIFNKRFDELLPDINIKKLIIKPLSIIHVSDLEKLEESLNKNPKEIWDFLDDNHRDRRFIPPFYNSVYRKWKYRKYPDKIVELYKQLIEKYFNGNKTAGNIGIANSGAGHWSNQQR